MQSTLQSPQKQSGFVRVTAKTLTRAYSSGPISTTVAKDTVILLDFDTKKTSKQELEKLGIDLNELIEGGTTILPLAGTSVVSTVMKVYRPSPSSPNTRYNIVLQYMGETKYGDVFHPGIMYQLDLPYNWDQSIPSNWLIKGAIAMVPMKLFYSWATGEEKFGVLSVDEFPQV